ncbi:hypothetical protein [Terriglobus sp. RCC_193]|uniref:hypothetical protein n=1 Tax=Terriglobus sp. RCC_193 TaxID=3239218 RepID=UPI003525731C
MKPVPAKKTLCDLAINFVWMCLIALVMASVIQGFVQAFDYDCTHPYQTPTQHHYPEER